jgi:hypothetical protein
VTYGDEGWYTCAAKNSFGMTFASAYLHVVDGKLQILSSYIYFLVGRVISTFKSLPCYLSALYPDAVN